MKVESWIVVNLESSSVIRPGDKAAAVAYAEREYGHDRIVEVNESHRTVYVRQIPCL